MYYALVTYAFCGMPIKKLYLVATDVTELVNGDVVEIVGYKKQVTYACFVRYVAAPNVPCYRKLVAKVDNDVLIELAKEQVVKNECIEVTKYAIDCYKKRFKESRHLSDEIVEQRLKRNLCIAAKVNVTHKRKGYKFYSYGYMFIAVKDSKIIYVKNSKGCNLVKWSKPRQLIAAIEVVLQDKQYSLVEVGGVSV